MRSLSTFTLSPKYRRFTGLDLDTTEPPRNPTGVHYRHHNLPNRFRRYFRLDHGQPTVNFQVIWKVPVGRDWSLSKSPSGPFRDHTGLKGPVPGGWYWPVSTLSGLI